MAKTVLLSHEIEEQEAVGEYLSSIAERKVELAFEGFSYWDLRRWGVAPNNYPDGLSGYQVHGLKIESAGSGFIYTYVSVDDKDRNYPEKMNRFPLQDSELSSNNAVEQFPEWK